MFYEHALVKQKLFKNYFVYFHVHTQKQGKRSASLSILERGRSLPVV